jgi:RHS repeat-associated protein
LFHANGSGNGYDSLNRLTNFARGTLNGTFDTISSPSTSNNWALDAQGNWTSTGSQTRTFNSQNQITGISGLTAPTYDNNGNTTKDQNGNSFTYDAWNRLVSLGGTNEVFSYDADGRRPAVTVCGTTITDSYYSLDWQVLEEDSRPTCGSAQVQNQYVWSLSYIDDLVLRDDNSTSGSLGKTGSGLGRRIYAEQDANHNVTSITDSGGTVLERFVYDAYGTFTVLTSGWVTTTDSKGWVYYFQGGRYDSTTKLYSFRFRDYNPTLGRWMEQDPAGYVDGGNVYQMELSNPAGGVDPFGLQVAVPMPGSGALMGAGGGELAWRTAPATLAMPPLPSPRGRGVP